MHLSSEFLYISLCGTRNINYPESFRMVGFLPRETGGNLVFSVRIVWVRFDPDDCTYVGLLV